MTARSTRTGRPARAGIAALLAAALAAQQQPAPAPEAPTPGSANGEPSAAALAEHLGSDPQAAPHLLRLGARAVPALVPYLEGKREWPQAVVDSAWPEMLGVLRDLGPDGGDAVDGLLAALDREPLRPHRDQMFAALGAIGPWLPRREAISVELGNRCDKAKYFGGNGFFETLSRLTFDARQERSALLQGLEHANAYVRGIAGEALARDFAAHPPKPDTARELLRILRGAATAELPTQFSLNWRWNGNGCSTGGGIDNVDRVRGSIALGLVALAPASPESWPGHVRLLSHTDPVVRIEAMRALGGLGEAAREALPAMIQALRGKDLPLAREAATMLGALGSVAEGARADLMQASKSADKQLAARASAALRQLP